MQRDGREGSEMLGQGYQRRRASHSVQRSKEGFLEEENESHSVLSDSLQHHGLYSPWNSPGQNTGVGSLSLLQRIFPIQESNPSLPHCRRILYQLNHKGSPRILEWVAYLFSRGIFPNPGLRSSTLQVDSDRCRFCVDL